MKNAILLKLLCVAFFISACSAKGSVQKGKNGDLPGWIVKPLENCEEGYLCGVGEGSGFLSAASNARSEIAKQLSVKVQSNTNLSIDQRNDTSTTRFGYSVDEGVNEIISGAKIKETFVDKNGDYYAFAVIDKNKIEHGILTEINNIDGEIQSGIMTQPLPVKKLRNLLLLREEKNRRYIMLTGRSVPERFKLKDIKNAKQNVNVYRLNIVDDSDIGLNSFIKSEIIDHFDKISSEALKTINGSVKLTKQYLNVSGFEKYEVNVDLSCIENGKVVGSIKVSQVETARNKQQVVDKAKEQIFKEISERIDSLLV